MIVFVWVDIKFILVLTFCTLLSLDLYTQRFLDQHNKAYISFQHFGSFLQL